MKYLEHSDIVVLGDSFAKFREQPNTWVRYFTETLTGSNKPARGAGFVGCAWWSVRNELMKQLEIKVPKVLVICHTEPMRLPSEQNFPLNYITAENPDKHMLPEHVDLKLVWRQAAAAASEYYKHLYIESFHVWAQRAWFKELDEIIEGHNIPYVIHMHCFKQWPPYKETYTFKNGMTVEEILYDHSSDRRMESDKTVGRYLNHFTDEENINLGKRLVDAVISYSVGKRRIGL